MMLPLAILSKCDVWFAHQKCHFDRTVWSALSTYRICRSRGNLDKGIGSVHRKDAISRGNPSPSWSTHNSFKSEPFYPKEVELPSLKFTKEDFRSLFIKRSSESMRFFLPETGSKVTFTGSNDSLNIVVEAKDDVGMKKSVSKVEDLIQYIVNTTERVEIPKIKCSKSELKSFIGANRNAIYKIQRETESEIWLGNSNDSIHAIVTVEDADKLENAVTKVQEKIHHIMNTTETVLVKVPKMKISNTEFEKLFVGAKGIEIGKLQKETESFIVLENWNDSPDPLVVVNVRDADRLDNAVTKVKDRIQYIINTTETIEIPQMKFPNTDFKKLFVGAKGIAIEKLKQETESDINFETRNDSLQIVVNVSDADKLNNAVSKVKDRIQYIINTTETVKIPQINYPNSIFKALFIGSKGIAIEKLKNETKSFINFESWDDALYAVVSVREAGMLNNAVSKVKDRIQYIINTTETIEIPQMEFPNTEFKRLFVGAKGIEIEKLQKESESDIKMESWNNTLHAVVSVRSADMLDNAVSKVKDRIQYIINTTKVVKIPKMKFPNTEFKQLFVGAKGIEIEKLQKETESFIVLENWNDSSLVVINVRDADRLDNAVTKVKEKIQYIVNNRNS